MLLTVLHEVLESELDLGVGEDAFIVFRVRLKVQPADFAKISVSNVSRLA